MTATYYFTNYPKGRAQEDLLRVSIDGASKEALPYCAKQLGFNYIASIPEDPTKPAEFFPVEDWSLNALFSKQIVDNVMSCLMSLRMGSNEDVRKQEEALKNIEDVFERFQFLRAYNRTIHKYGRNMCDVAYSLVEGYLRKDEKNPFVQGLKHCPPSNFNAQ